MSVERTSGPGMIGSGWSAVPRIMRQRLASDVQEVRAELRREHIVEHFALDVSGPALGWWRGHECPACHKRWVRLAASGFCIGRRGWMCKACGVKGDLLDLLARLASDDVRREFALIVKLGAQLAGVRPTDDAMTRAQRLAEISQAEMHARLAQIEVEAKRRHDARQNAPRIWNNQLIDHPTGRAYLISRGLDVDTLIGRDLVRFCPVGWRPADVAGDPTVVLYDWDGAPLSLVRRRTSGDEPKTPGVTGHPTDGTLVGHLGLITPNKDVIVTEGVIDSLTAAVAWPDAVVLGAHGATHVAKICEHAAPVVKAHIGRLLIVPDADRPGQRAAIAGAERAMIAGLALKRDLVVVELDGHPDLNAAWCAGWRP